MSGSVLPFSSKQIELVSTLDLLFGRSGLSFFQNKPGEQLEETDAASKQKSFNLLSLQSCDLVSLTPVLKREIIDCGNRSKCREDLFSKVAKVLD